MRHLVPANERFAFPSVFHACFYAPDSPAYLDRLGRWFLATGYPYYFALVVPFGVAVFGWSFGRLEDAEERRARARRLRHWRCCRLCPS